MKEVLLALNQQPIAVYPIYIDITGSVTAGVLLSQVMYWDSKMKGKAFYKNDASFMEETRLTQSEFKTAKKIISGLSFLNIERKGAPYRTWYEVDHDELFVVLRRFSSSFTYEPGSRLPTNQRGVNLRTIIGTENTHETTSENTTESFVENEFSTVTLIDEIDETMVEIHHVPEYFETEQETPTPQVAPPPRPKKAKKEKADNPAPITLMFEVYAAKFAELNNGQKPEFMKKYAPALKSLYSILEARSVERGIVLLDKLQPWRDFVEMWGNYLKTNQKETWHRDNFNPMTFFSQFNSIIAKLQNRPQTDAEKWVEWMKKQGIA